MPDKLMGCPLCGGKAYGGYKRNEKGNIIGVYIIGCEKCDISFSAIDGTEEEAIKKWNKRV